MAASGTTGYAGRDGRGRPRRPNGRCNECGAPLAWATASMGHRTALDAGIVDTGQRERLYVLLERDRGRWRVCFEVNGRELAEELEGLGFDVRTCHFDTCEVRREARRPRERADIDG